MFTGAIVAANIAMGVWNTITAITKALNYALSASFTALQVASGLIIFTALVAVFIALQKRFNIIQKVIAGVQIVFDKLSDAVKWLASKFVDFVNTLIDVANKIPFVEIQKINNVFEEQADLSAAAAAGVDLMKKPLDNIRDAMADARYEADLANMEFDTAKAVMDELHPTMDDVDAAIERMNDEMDKHIKKQQFLNDNNTDLIDTFNVLFDKFDNRRIVQDFADAIDDAREAIREYGENSLEAVEASEEMYIALGNVINELDNIPATKQLELLAKLDRDWETAH